MERVLFILLILSLTLFSCSKKKKYSIKILTKTEYSTKINGDVYVKDTIKSKYSMGYYPNGNQHFFVGLVGYDNQDTTWLEDSPKDIILRVEKENNYTYHYKNEELTSIAFKKNDTTFVYEPGFLNRPIYYWIEDLKGTVEEHNYLLWKTRYYLNREFDKNGLPTFLFGTKRFIRNFFECVDIRCRIFILNKFKHTPAIF